MYLARAMPVKHHAARLLLAAWMGMFGGCMKTTQEGIVMKECPELNLRSERSIVEVLSRASNNSLVAECLVRVAKRERDIDPNDPEQVDYIRRFQHLLQRDPTTDQIIKWQQENPFPKKKSQR